jgi:RimJ/RimL family protein N-acetyltransferase
MRIREARVEDWEKLKDLLNELIHEEPPVALELEPLIMKGREFLASFPKGNQGHFSVAEDKGKIVGFCYLVVPKFYKPVAYIGIVLVKEYRRKTIGSMLFYHVIGWAEGTNIQYIVADIWSWNKGSIKFFDSLGFIEKEVFKDKFKGREEEKVRLVRNI